VPEADAEVVKRVLAPFEEGMLAFHVTLVSRSTFILEGTRIAGTSLDHSRMGRCTDRQGSVELIFSGSPRSGHITVAHGCEIHNRRHAGEGSCHRGNAGWGGRQSRAGSCRHCAPQVGKYALMSVAETVRPPSSKTAACFSSHDLEGGWGRFGEVAKPGPPSRGGESS